MNQLDSALVIALRDTIKWDSALNETPDGLKISETGLLYPVTGTEVFDPRRYQYRDRQLAYRDLINAAAMVEVSVQVSDVWNYPAIKPTMQGPAEQQMPAVVASQISTSGTASLVRHVTNISVPYDAARYADSDLYGRDCLIYEVLARACEQAFTDPPIQRIDAAGTVLPDTSIWSLASAGTIRADINPALPLNRALFKNADIHLAERDNQMAGYVARLARVLKNPFEFATRLYVQISNVDEREPEVYVLASDGDVRVWVAEPALPNRNRIEYDKAAKTLTWTRERVDEIHVPQLYAMSIPGIEIGQTLDTLSTVPDRKDAQYWRGKAVTVVPTGGSFADALYLGFTASSAAVGGYLQLPAASLTVPDQLQLTLPGNLDQGRHRIALLVNPNPVVEIAGASNVSGDSGTLGGATFEIAVPSGGIGNKSYFVEGGDGIIYSGGTYQPGTTFGGTVATPAYTQAGASPSTVRQYGMAWRLALPPGPWTLEIDYTNLQHVPDGFGIVAQYAANGALPLDIIQDVVPAPFTGTNGDVVTSSVGHFDVASADSFTVPVFWTYGTGQLHIRQLTFRNTQTTACRIAMGGTLGTGAGNVDVTAEASRPETLLFHVANQAVSPAVVTLNLGGTVGVDNLLPVQILQVQVQDMGTYNATPVSGDFAGWRQESLDRAEHAVQQSFNEAVTAFGTNLPVFFTSGSSWDYTNSDAWMSLIETRHPRLRELDNIPTDAITTGRQYEVTSGVVVYDSGTYVTGDKFYGLDLLTVYSGGTVRQVGAFAVAKPGHVGQPCLIPLGLEFNSGVVELALPGSLALPVVAATQPWMIAAGLYSAQSEFWMPQYL